MNQKAIVNLEIEKDGYSYVFSMPVGSPIGSAYNAAFDVLQEIIKLSQKAAENARPLVESDIPESLGN